MDFFLLNASEIIFPFMISSYCVLLLVMWELNVHYINMDRLACIFWVFLLKLKTYNWKSENQDRQ